MNITRTGSTLATILIFIGCVGLVYTIVTSITPHYAGLSAMAVCTGLDAENQEASKVLSQDIHSARSLESPTVNELVLSTPKGNISYTFDAACRCLTRVTNSKSQKLLSHVDSFSFSLLRPDAHRALGLANPRNARAVGCGWSSSIKVAGVNLDSDQVRMAPIILRNR